MSNVIKYTKNGEQIIVRIIRKPDYSNGYATYEFHVKDNGIGMSKEFQKHLFEARLRGAQKMGLYLASNLGQIALNLLACVILVPRIGFAGFWMSSWISAPIGMLLAAVLANLSGTSHQLP